MRYADDCYIYVRSQRPDERMMAGTERFLAQRLKLRVDRANSSVAAPRVRKCLGFSFTTGTEIKRHLVPQTLALFDTEYEKRRAGPAAKPHSSSRNWRYLIGWHAYFGFLQTPSVLRETART